MATHRRQTTGLVCVALATIVGLATAARGAESSAALEAIPYGPPASPEAPLIDLASGARLLRLTGCRPGAPVIALFHEQSAAIRIAEGLTLCVRPGGQYEVTTADRQGHAEIALPRSAGEVGSSLCVQAFTSAPGSGAILGTAALRLQWTESANGAPGGAPEGGPTLELPPVLVEEIGRLVDARLLEQALELALNSPGDTVSLDLGGNLSLPIPAVPGLTAGGQIAFKVQVACGADAEGRRVLDLSIGADVAATAGLGAGIAGVSCSAGAGVTQYWRFASAADVAQAIRSLALLLAMGPSLEQTCVAVDHHFDALGDAVDAARDAADRAREAVRSRAPWRNLRVVQVVREHLDDAREQRRARFDAAWAFLDQLVSAVTSARAFITEHELGFEVRAATAVEAKVGKGGVGDDKKNGEWALLNLGAGFSGSIRREFSTRVDHDASGGQTLTTKAAFTKAASASAACLIGADLSVKRVLEVSSQVAIDASGSSVTGDATVKLVLDGRLMGALGLVVAGKFGVGGEVSAEVGLRDLLASGPDAIATLLGDDEDSAVRLLRSLPIVFKVQGRIEAEVAIGIGLKIQGLFEAGIGGSVNVTDRGVVREHRGLPSAAWWNQLLASGPLTADARATLGEVERQVASRMSSR